MTSTHAHRCPKCGMDWPCEGNHVYSLGADPPKDNYTKELVCTPCLRGGR